jgi:hypothetical protein
MKICLRKGESNSNLNSSFSDVEKLYNSYIEQGSATRKMDAIIFKIDEEKQLNLLYDAGLHCFHHIKSPLNKKLMGPKGDSTCTIDFEDI